MTTIADLLLWGCGQLEGLGDRESRGSTERLLEHLLKTDRSSLYLKGEHRISEEIIHDFEAQIRRRKERVPLAYLTGKAFFWNECLEVGPGCFIPRPETEHLVEEVIRIFRAQEQNLFSFLDLGTGSGAIALAILRSFESCEATLVDISSEALSYAGKNLERYGLQDRASVVCLPPHPNPFPKGEGSIQKYFPLPLGGEGRVRGKWDLIVSNPPYLSEEEWIHAQPEIKFEPQVALEAGPDGCDFYRSFIREAPRCLKENGWLVMEIGSLQGGKVKTLVAQAGCFHSTRILQDDSGLDRVVVTQLRL